MSKKKIQIQSTWFSFCMAHLRRCSQWHLRPHEGAEWLVGRWKVTCFRRDLCQDLVLFFWRWCQFFVTVKVDGDKDLDEEYDVTSKNWHCKSWVNWWLLELCGLNNPMIVCTPWSDDLLRMNYLNLFQWPVHSDLLLSCNTHLILNPLTFLFISPKMSQPTKAPKQKTTGSWFFQTNQLPISAMSTNERPTKLSRLKELVGPRLQELVYRVHPLPESLIDVVSDFGSLSEASEVGSLPGIPGVLLLFGGGWCGFHFFLGRGLKIIYEACIYCSLAVYIIHTWHIFCIKEVLEDDRYYPTVYVVMILVHSSESSGCGSARRYTSKPFCARPGAGGWWESAWDSSLNMLVL